MCADIRLVFMIGFSGLHLGFALTPKHEMRASGIRL